MQIPPSSLTLFVCFDKQSLEGSLGQRRLDLVDVAVNVDLQHRGGMIGGPPRRFRHHALKPQHPQIQFIDEDVDRPAPDCPQPRNHRGTRGAKRLAFSPRPRQSASFKPPNRTSQIVTDSAFSHMSGRIWTPPDCNRFWQALFKVTTADVYPASLRGLIDHRREPHMSRWESSGSFLVISLQRLFVRHPRF
jgi:hypothetical protein